MKSISFCVLSLNLLALPAAFAADPWEPGGTLETCLEAVLKERPGIVTGWQQSGGGEMTPYVVSVLSPEGTNAEAFCNPANPTNFQFKSKTGLFRYSMYQRATFAEAKARASAPEIFTGPVRVTSMELSVGVSGKPMYRYQMFLPSNHKATVEIDAVTGRLNKGEVN
ncbi:MAG: hypothetical protein HY067_10570 [Betaproteobacteria bacterium]|nr:hypothetical protein [Betaproteobacteria bacterium]